MRSLKETPSRSSSAITREAPSKVDRGAGLQNAGLIRGMSAITGGEALGHDMWLDSHFLDQVAEKLESGSGTKVRFKHPGLSSDGLGNTLGRAVGGQREGNKVLTDLHLLASAHETPEGNLANYVLDFAEESPDLFGTSIVFKPDHREMELFRLQHSDSEGENFKSPDPANVKNLRHARLDALRAVDVVDEPAANPAGMFSSLSEEGEMVEAFEALLEYATGLSDEEPKENDLIPIHPGRIRRFTSQFFDSRGLTLHFAENSRKPEPKQKMKSLLTLLGKKPEKEDLSAYKAEVDKLLADLEESESSREQASEEARVSAETLADFSARLAALEEKLTSAEGDNKKLLEEVSSLQESAQTVEEAAEKKANQKLSQMGHSPLEVVEEDEESNSDDNLLAQYNALDSGLDKQAFLAEHKHELNRLAKEQGD